MAPVRLMDRFQAFIALHRIVSIPDTYGIPLVNGRAVFGWRARIVTLQPSMRFFRFCLKPKPEYHR